MAVPLPISYLDVMLNNLEIIGQFMYSRDTFMRLVDLARAGLLDLRAIRARSFPLESLPPPWKQPRRLRLSTASS